MPISFNGSGTITGISTGGLPDGCVTPSELSQKLTSGTSVNLPNDGSAGTNITFTGIPSWVKRITVIFNGVSVNSVSPILVQLGTSSGYVSSGYTSYWGYAYASGTSTTSSSAGFGLHIGSVSEIIWANLILTNITGNTWVCSYSGVLETPTTTGVMIVGGGKVNLSATLNSLKVTTVSGSVLFDLGDINIMYEG